MPGALESNLRPHNPPAQASIVVRHTVPAPGARVLNLLNHPHRRLHAECPKPLLAQPGPLPVGAEWSYRSEQHELLIAEDYPRPMRRYEFNCGLLRLAVVPRGPALFLLYQIGSTPAWHAVPYSWYHTRPSERFLPNLRAYREESIFRLLAVNARDGHLVAHRSVKLSHVFSLALSRALRDQAAQPFDQDAYDAAVDGTYAAFPRPIDLLEQRVAQWSSDEGGAWAPDPLST